MQCNHSIIYDSSVDIVPASLSTISLPTKNKLLPLFVKKFRRPSQTRCPHPSLSCFFQHSRPPVLMHHLCYSLLWAAPKVHIPEKGDADNSDNTRAAYLYAIAAIFLPPSLITLIFYIQAARDHTTSSSPHFCIHVFHNNRSAFPLHLGVQPYKHLYSPFH